MSLVHNGRGEAEVLGTFSDGHQYSKTRLERSLQEIMALKRPKSTKDSVTSAKREDVDFIVNELAIPRSHAEKALLESEGDLAKALSSLIMS